MRIIKRIIALLLTLAIAAGLSACKPPKRALTDEEKSRIQTRFQDTITDRGVSAAVYAVYRDEVIFDGGAGMATLTDQNASDVAYGIASLTKQFTAAAVMQLYEQEKLDITDPLSKYFPGYEYGDVVCISQLLSHRSGIPDYQVESDGGMVYITCSGNDSEYLMIDVKDSAEINRGKIRSFFLSQELRFEPGTGFSYSDSNFALLAEIVAQVSGMSYHDYVREHIFEPLGMKSSGFIDDYDQTVIKKAALTDREEFDINYYTVGGAEYGCGDILTTPQDLYRWYRGLVGGEVVGKAAYELMTTNYSVFDELGYGFGLMISDNSESKVVYHYGYIPSYYSAVIYIPEYDYFETVLSNHADGDPQRLAADLAEYFGSVIDLELINIG